MNFYRPKYVTCKKTESGRHTRWPRDRGACPGRVSAPSTLVEASCPSWTASFFPNFLNIPKQIKIAIRIVLESVYLPYHIPIPFRSLERSGKCPVCIPPGTVNHLRIRAFEVVDFYGTGTIDLLDNVGTFPFREKFSCKKS